jgi:DNA replicative helicase MCM subunit Mcm2 (Cdc46/Mcm family)
LGDVKKGERIIRPLITYHNIRSIFPGILLQLFGGTNKSVAKGGGGGGPRYRGDINVLLVGDPGSGKSQVLQVRFSWGLNTSPADNSYLVCT